MRMKLIPLVCHSWQGHGVVGAVGAKDWRLGLSTLRARPQSSTFVGNEQPTVESRKDIWVSISFFCWFLSGLGNQRITPVDFQNHNESNDNSEKFSLNMVIIVSIFLLTAPCVCRCMLTMSDSLTPAAHGTIHRTLSRDTSGAVTPQRSFKHRWISLCMG